MTYKILLLLVIIGSCGSNGANAVRQSNEQRDIHQRLKDINRILVRKESQKIKNYVDSLNLKMRPNGTGLWYHIVEEGEGVKPTSGDVVTLEYEIKLMDGTIAYSSDSTGYKIFAIDRSNEMRGINDAARLIGLGGKIDLIMPRHMSKGVMGDMKKIPPMQTLLCSLKIIRIEKY